MPSSTKTQKIPVILDTDIGSDIDDTWALAFLLNCPELDLKLVVSDTGDTLYRAKLLGKLLEAAGRADVPVGIGIPLEPAPKPQQAWVANYALENYPGPVYADGVGAIIDCIRSSSEPVTIVAIGPVANIAAALNRDPDIVKNTNFVGMQGSIYEGNTSVGDISPEYNVVRYPYACQKVFSAPWDNMTITPLDTCGKVRLEGDDYNTVKNCSHQLIQAVIENYRLWAQYPDWAEKYHPDKSSSILFDTVAVYLAFSQDLLIMENLNIEVTDDGYTVIREGAKSIKFATGWKNITAFYDLLTERLSGNHQD